MSNLAYQIGKGLLNTVDWTDGTKKYRLLLATNSYVPSATHQHVSDITNEATGTGYARKLLGSRSRANSGTLVQYKAAAPNWAAITSAFRYAIVYYDVDGSDGDDTTAWLVCCLDLGGTQTFVAANFTLEFGGVDPGPVFEIV